ncbi:MAG: hypothetical protein JNN07_20400 [Verrucomicrobiales bacterium]|nr:hypothetical protein [Verrucomicrobiales bacterium]
MKPCPQHRKSIALFAAGSLSSAASAPVQEHLDLCPGCKEYHQEILTLCQRQTEAADHLQPATLPTQIYERVALEIRNSTPLASPPCLVDPRRSWLPRFAAAAAVLALLIGAWKFDRSGTAVLPPAVDRVTSMASGANPAMIENDSSLGYYRKTVIRSLDDLDRLVNQQADRVEGFAVSLRLNQGLLD